MYPRVLFLNLNVKESVFKERIFACIMLRFILASKERLLTKTSSLFSKKLSRGVN